MEQQYTAIEAQKLLFGLDEINDFDEILSSDSDADDDFPNPSTAEAMVIDNEFSSENVRDNSKPMRPFVTLDPDARIGKSQRQKNKIFVCSIDDALNENNYNTMSNSSTEKTYEASMELAKSKKNKEGNIKWSNIPPNLAGRQSSANVITGNTGVKNEYKKILDPRKAWELFFSSDMISSIVFNTNKKIEMIRDKSRAYPLDDSTYVCMKNTSAGEIYAFIGLLYLRGLLGQNNYDVSILFNDLTGNPIFGATMSKNRFKFLFANIAFDDATTRNERWCNDRFAALRDLFEMFNRNCSSCVIPGDFLSLDETLYPMRVQIGFKQYNPQKTC